MSTKTATDESSSTRLAELSHLAEDVLARCRAAGADQAEVGLNDEQGLNVSVRLGQVETLEFTRDRGLSITVYLGKSKATASTGDLAPASIQASIEQALAIARYTEADPAAGLADAELMCREFPELDLWHPVDLNPDAAIALATECEQFGRDVDSRISNSEGGSVSHTLGMGVYANSHGFVGAERATRHSLSCVLVASDDSGMQRDYSYSTARCFDDLDSAETVGRQAAERTLRRLGGRQLSTLQVPVIFAPEVARGLIGHLVSACSGGALYRRASFLLDSVGEKLFPDFVNLLEQPHLLRGLGSAAFDAEGVATRSAPLVSDGVLQRYVLGSYSARRMGLQTTANAGGVRNLVLQPGAQDLAQMIHDMQRGLLVTEVMGQGVNTVTGDYSRGASGFWIENGEIAYPVEEITIAGHLRKMFAGIQALGSDVDRRGGIHSGSIRIDQMTVAGS